VLIITMVLPERQFAPEVSAKTVQVVKESELINLGMNQVLSPREIPGTSEIIYGKDDKLWIWDQNQNIHRALPLGPLLYMRNAAPSPDGSRIALVGYQKGSAGIWLVNRDGSSLKLLAAPASMMESYDSPSWSPDGKMVAFSKTLMEARPGHGFDVKQEEIWIADVVTGQARMLTAGKQPAWSPDGKQLAFTRTVSSPDGEKQQIWTIRLDGTDAVTLTEGMEPSWSPNGDFIAFSRYNTSAFAAPQDAEQPDGSMVSASLRELWAIHVPSKTLSQLTHSRVDLSRIHFDAAPTGSGQPIRYVTSGEFADWEPSWSKDGQSILLVRDINEEKGNHFSLYRLQVEYE